MLDLDKALKTFSSILKNNGYLCIGDLVKEDGSFHKHIEGFYGHNGFNRQGLREKMLTHNFTVEYYNECFVIEREMDNKIKKFPLFLMICKKNIWGQ